MEKRVGRIVFMIVLVLTSTMIVSGIQTESTEIADVLIYNGSGVWNDGVIAFERFLECRELTLFKCDDSYIENNELVGNFDVLFFPGGDFTAYANQINSVGLQNIRDFINAGGGYLGICGGGYFACDQVTWRSQTIDMPLDIFNGLGYGPIDEIAPWLEYTMTSITMNESNPITHPEIEEDSARDNVSFSDELSDFGTDWNILCTCMDWLMGLPISEPPAPLPPYNPGIDGPGSGTPGTEYDYTFHAEDPEEEEMYYWIDWGDDCNSSWIGPYDSGEAITLSHIWTEKDTYVIGCKAKDPYGDESDWSTLEVTMPKNKQIQNMWLLRFFERFPRAFPIFRQLIGFDK